MKQGCLVLGVGGRGQCIFLRQRTLKRQLIQMNKEGDGAGKWF